jgi:hypothetical protein
MGAAPCGFQGAGFDFSSVSISHQHHPMYPNPQSIASNICSATRIDITSNAA